MSTNPFEPPNEVNERPKPRAVKWWLAVLLKLVAIGLWVMALILVAASWDVLNRPELIPNRIFSPGLFWATAVVTFGLPVTSLLLFGIASWRRSKPFAYAGLGAIGLIPLYILCIFLIGTIRRWITQ